MREEASQDVLIVGAGPAGCAAGITLARQGHRVTVLDRATFPRPKTCGDALSNNALRLLDELGVGDRLAKAPSATVRGAVAILPDGTRIRRDYGDAPGRIVPRLDLDDALRRALSDAGAVVREGVSVRALERLGARVVGARSDDTLYRADVVIAADGHGSVAWEPSTRPRGRGLAVSATVYVEGLAPAEAPDVSEHYFEHDLPCGYGWIFPAVDGVANAGVYLRADAFRPGAGALHKLLEAFLARRAPSAGRRVGPVRTWSLPLAGAHRPAGAPGLLVCGDAGRYIDPLTGEGIFQALRTGQLAGEAAASMRVHGDRARWAYLARCARVFDAPSAVRAGIQDALRFTVDRGLYRRAWVQAALRWGYGGGALEITKRVAR